MGIKIQPPGPAAPLAPQASLTAKNSTLGPAANANLAAINAPLAGLYKVDIYIELSGTVAAADQDNIRLQVDSVTVSALPVSASITSGDVQAPITVYLRTNGTNIRLQAIALATGTAVYGTFLVATLVGS